MYDYSYTRSIYYNVSQTDGKLKRISTLIQAYTEQNMAEISARCSNTYHFIFEERGFVTIEKLLTMPAINRSATSRTVKCMCLLNGLILPTAY